MILSQKPDTQTAISQLQGPSQC
ncbi:hypothetical protein [Runella slithyformis]